MKKLFFFRSSSSNGSDKSVSPTSTDKKVYWENPFGSGVNNEADEKSSDNNFRSPKGLFSKSRKHTSDSPGGSGSSVLRRSRSFSSAAFLKDGLGERNFSCLIDQSRSPTSSTRNAVHQQRNHSSQRSRAFTPERQPRENQFEVDARGSETLGSSGSSENSSCGSSNASTKVLDRYIDGEEQLERSRPTNSSQRNSTKHGIENGNVNFGGRLPPRFQCTGPISPTGSIKGKPKSHSFREPKGPRYHFTSSDLVENGFGHESPRRLARNVVERLSQTRVLPKSGSKDFDHDIPPITIEDIYGGPSTRCSDTNSDVAAYRSYLLDEPYETINGIRKQNGFMGESLEGLNSVEVDENKDLDLQRRYKEAEERVMAVSEELEQGTFLRNGGFDVPALIQTIRSLAEDKRSLALEVSDLLQSRIAERASSREELRLANLELESRTRKLEKEKNELQLGLEKELDRRSSDWSLKLEKYQMEEQRLRERVRELAEQNVSLQREVCSFNEREAESRKRITYSEQHLKDLSIRFEQYTVENQNLRRNLSELEENYKAAAGDLDCFKRNFEEKETECKELQQSITRLLRTCSEQEKTIAGLREGFSEEMAKKQHLENFDKQVLKLQTEQMRLTGIEFSLRREIESYRVEIDSLRHENINLLNRLKRNGKENGALTIKLDNELWTRVCFLQNHGLSMLNGSTELCSQLLEFIKGKASQVPETKQGVELINNVLDGQFIVESHMKVQGFKRGTESLERSLGNVSSLLHEKSSMVASKSQALLKDADSGKMNDQTPEEALRSELKAEILLTNLLREKLYSKELEVEQLQAELATAVRGNDILRCEVQNALDNLSCVTHKLKDMELQMLKKDENVNQLQNNLQNSSKELKIMKGMLPKVSQERDLMWEEVKQYNEKNMLLNSEVIALKKKIDVLEEDILVKEGQISILKDSLGSKPFDLLTSPDSMREFLLQ